MRQPVLRDWASTAMRLDQVVDRERTVTASAPATTPVSMSSSVSVSALSTMSTPVPAASPACSIGMMQRRATRDDAAAEHVHRRCPDHSQCHHQPTTIRREWPNPNHADETPTQGLEAGVGPIDMRVLDHFIVAGAGVVSFPERGLS